MRDNRDRGIETFRSIEATKEHKNRIYETFWRVKKGQGSKADVKFIQEAGEDRQFGGFVKYLEKQNLAKKAKMMAKTPGELLRADQAQKQRKSEIHNAFWRVKNGQGTSDDFHTLAEAQNDYQFRGFVNFLERKHQEVERNKKFAGDFNLLNQRHSKDVLQSSVAENIVVKKMNGEVLQPGEFSTEDITKLFRVNKDFEKKQGKIEKIKTTTREDILKDVREMDIYLQKKAINGIKVKGEGILPVGNWPNRGGERRDIDPKSPDDRPDYDTSKIRRLLKVCTTDNMIVIETSKSRGLGKYYGFEVINKQGKSFMICESMKKDNALYIFNMTDGKYIDDIFQEKRDVIDAKMYNSFERKIHHTDNYFDRLVSDLDRR